ncbi:MAG: hypothetical protein HYR77_09070 [Ignavibacteria bacterium]|nr:hypothetical protein [Ignavibacteria bacterium]
MAHKLHIIFLLAGMIVLGSIGTSAVASDKSAKLLDLATKEFGSLSKAEQKFFRAQTNGTMADYTTGDDQKDSVDNAEWWDTTRVLRATRIAWLCRDPQASILVSDKGIQVRGVRIDEGFDVEESKITFLLYFEKCSFKDKINLRNAEIKSLYLIGTHTASIQANGLIVEKDCFLRDGFKAEGEVSLLRAKIGGDLDCSSGQFIDSAATALSGDGLKVEGAVFLYNGFNAEGEVSLRFANIGLNLECDNGVFINKGGTAIDCEGSTVKGDVFLRDDIKVEGKMDFFAATVDGYFHWRNVSDSSKASLDLRSAKLASLLDDQRSWPETGKLYLDGLMYNEISEYAPMEYHQRIDWLHRQPDSPFHPQPYEQLATVLRKSGHDDDATEILIQMQKDRGRLANPVWYQWPWYHIFGPVIAFGYRPWRSFWYAIGFISLGSIFFGIGYRKGLVVAAREKSEGYPKFNALVYSLDVFAPLIDLYQADYYLPQGKFLRFYHWFQIIAGWVLTTLLAVGLSGLVVS